jgi:hypothetical protein
MEQNYNIKTTLEKIILINNLPIQFSINDRRPITFRCPTIREMITDLDFLSFLSVLSLTPEKIKEQNIKLSFTTNTRGEIIQGLIFINEVNNVLQKYFVKLLQGAELVNNREIFVNGEKVLSYEWQYIADTILVSLGQEEYVDKKQTEKQKEVESNPIMSKILQAQKENEDKIKKAKQKQSSNNITFEEVMLSILYEFGIPFEKMLDMNYYGVLWCFGYVGKVDAHKMNQMILSSGMSKEKNYNYWLNK